MLFFFPHHLSRCFKYALVLVFEHFFHLQDGVVYVKGLSDDVANTLEERSNVITISGNDFLHKDYRMVVGMVDVILGDIVYPEMDASKLKVFFAHNILFLLLSFLLNAFLSI